jgi:hypothetical protein
VAKGKRLRCPGCGRRKASPRTGTCKRCGKRLAMGAAGMQAGKSAAPAFLAKSFTVPRCSVCSWPGRGGSRHCSRCGSLMPGMLGIVKSAAGSPWEAEWRHASDPDKRELLWRLMHDQGGAA